MHIAAPAPETTELWNFQTIQGDSNPKWLGSYAGSLDHASTCARMLSFMNNTRVKITFKRLHTPVKRGI